MPTASMRACMVVGPTNVKPLRRRALDSARDSGELVGTSSYDVGVGVEAGRKDQTRSTRPPSGRSATVARALVMVASI